LAIVLAKGKEVSPARRAAFEILRRVAEGAFSSVLLAADDPRLRPADRALCHELVLGVLRWQLLLDKIVEHFSKRTIESLDLPVRIALRLGLYQLRFLSRIPASAAVNESVSLVRSARLSSAAAFVNAVLRRAIREAEYDPASETTDPLERIAIQTSHPIWLIDRWVNAFGLDEAESFARANNEVPPTAFRVVHTRTNEGEVLSRLGSASASSVLRELAAEGLIYLQDEASQLVAHTLDAHPGERVLDLCAAPGGKTTLIADLSDDNAMIVAADRSAARMTTVMKTAALQKLKSIRPVLLDAGATLPFTRDAFDRVLVDAPCSGTGTLRRNPEIRWRLSNSDILNFAATQKRFLRNAADAVRPGGQLVYSTCSVESEENEEVIDESLKEDHRFQPLKTIRTWPHREGTDGFFMAVLQRKS
jgi:16S rRNA (cytosine967-C5)-methyltransferase